MICLAHNRDGLGERLRAIVNAMVLARHLGGAFRFAWPELRAPLRGEHAIIDAKDFFAADFIRDHMIPADEIDTAGAVPLREVAGEIAAGTGLPEGSVISVQQPHLQVQARPVFAKTGIAPALAEAFAEIAFTDEMEKARTAAAAAALPAPAAAIHLRAGDVIYGMYRTMDDFQGKVVPYPLAIELVERLRADGAAPVVFGQDADLTRMLRDDHGAVRADDLGARTDFSQTQNALFDICLMGRCQRIFAGSSGFAVIASWLAQVEIENPMKIFETEEAIALIEKHVFDPDASALISGHQKAFAARAPFVLAGRTIADTDRYWRLLNAARDGDPSNDFTQFVYACSLYEAGDSTPAEALLEDLFDRPPPERGRLMAILKNAGARGVRAGPYLDGLSVQARAGWPMAALCCALSYKALKRPEAAEMKRIFEKNATPRMQAFSDRLFA